MKLNTGLSTREQGGIYKYGWNMHTEIRMGMNVATDADETLIKE